MSIQGVSPCVPFIDVSGLRSGRLSDLHEIGRRIGVASRSIGFFSIVNHGLEQHVAEVLAEAERFFRLPLDAKERVAIRSYFCGYTRLDQEHGDPHEAFDIGPELSADEAATFADATFYAASTNRWPDLPHFRERVTAYYRVGVELIVQLHRAIAVDLGADVDYFTPFFPRMVGLRMLHYPPHPAGRSGWGISPHTDFGNLTLLAQDRAGLELQTREGTWLPTAARTDALMCNIGDCLMRWSNDIYVSTPHRVLNQTARDRHSVAVFGDVNTDTVVSCLPSCEHPDLPAKHAPIRFGEYARSRFAGGYATTLPQRGEFDEVEGTR